MELINNMTKTLKDDLCRRKRKTQKNDKQNAKNSKKIGE